MHLGKYIKKYRDTNNLSMAEFAKESGISKAYVSILEKNRDPRNGKEIIPSIPIIKKVSDTIGISFDDLLNSLDENQIVALNETKTEKNLTSSTLQKITSTSSQLEQPRQEKVLSFANEQLEEQNNVISMFDRKVEETENYITDYVEGLVAAGLGAYQEDNLHMEVKLRADDVPDKYDTIAKVAGNSMEPLIQDNDLLFIKVSSQVDMNDIGIFQVNGKNFVKKLKRDYDGAWYLQSLNKSYEEIYLSENDNIRTIGEVVDIYRES
ncbi:TPA: helix-turn-helix domain-containing protein [Streptococcus agalactiae]|uniref:Repressor n=1 Tax=Streptococcus agalactiae TaxID=1311 RepID=A0AAW3HT77_STRAG|nr:MULTISPECIES: S24 family peptidase [Streptococcus]AIF86096.1 repressor [Streptococcus agalactiae]EMA8753677.1 helix-turn-helix transcriptional regulator [Streptococcus agalactiae]EMA8755662.1 helix-turn-helix transcriptional regulator [Streptococcus agalactiae]EPT46375.1 repressor [Streptococcus agalactiae FSL S3-337]EPT51453.1 repressor [Streptococcus agalactiae FSL S3-003]